MKFLQSSWKALLIILIFSLAYLILGIIKHNHFLSGYDLAVSDQGMWQYSHFHIAITTLNAYAFTPMMADHVEFIYMFLSPLFWVWNNALALISFQAIFFCLSGIPAYLLARKKGLNQLLSLVLLISYLSFFGVQNALWNDVHSNVFGVGFLMWMIYFLESGNNLWMWISFFFAITSKEDMAFLTGAIGVVWLIKNTINQRHSGLSRIFSRSWMHFVYQDDGLKLIFFSLVYLFLVFVVYFPHFTSGYRFAGGESLFANIAKFNYLVDTPQKKEIILSSLGWFGFLPIFAPLFLIPWFADLYHFFVLGHAVAAASEIFLHYRISLAPLLLWPTIVGITVILNLFQNLKNRSRNKFGMTTNSNVLQFLLALYLLLCAFFVQYALHLPLSYLTKSWFWHTDPEVATINKTLQYVPDNASVVAQINIAPHIAHRNNIFTLWPSTMSYKNLADSPCGQLTCPWFRWVGNPQYMIVDTSSDFDIRHFLQNRPDFLSALSTFEKLGKIKILHRDGTTTLYQVLQNP